MELKKGYTTGTCATIAAKAAAEMLFLGKKIEKESIITPSGVKVECDIINIELKKNAVSCGVKKYSGDDPDVTNGILIYAEVKLKKERELSLDGGIGVGRVTKSGLQQKIGEAAINKVPRKMILNAVAEAFEKYGYEGGADILISIPEGVEIAKKTFNPRLGIVGGISVLGTSGIVEPMSEQAIIDTIKVEIDVKKANEGDYIMIAPGNYGIDFIKQEFNLDLDKAVKCSNFIGDALDFAVKADFKGVLLIGHIGKLVKLGAGIMNTHSRNADGRMEVFAANTAMVSDNIGLIRKIMECITTDEAIKLLKEENICDRVMERITDKIKFYVDNRVKNEIEIGIIVFSNVYGILGKSSNADDLINRFKAGE